MIDADAVAAWLKLLDATATADAAVLDTVAAAVTSYIDGLPDKPVTPDPLDETLTVWSEQTTLAALMLAARLYRRRLSPAGVEAFGEAGSAYVSRYDSDIARMLRIDVFTRPAVG